MYEAEDVDSTYDSFLNTFLLLYDRNSANATMQEEIKLSGQALDDKGIVRRL